MALTVTISIVLYNSARDIEACLRSLQAQTLSPTAIVVVDNASRDDGVERALRTEPAVRVLRLGNNIGFAAAQNRAILAEPAEVHVVLNPDCRLAPAFLERAVQVLMLDEAVGSVSGRLLRFREDDDAGPLWELPDDRLDSTGMVALRNRRVLDRGSGLPAKGRYLGPAYVFGASGAAAVYRRAMLEDIALGSEIFDESFFAYREDVDLAWRAQLFGWQCRYEPTALARHRRFVTPERRRFLPANINRMSVANRWRLIAKNEVPLGWRLDWAHIVARDVLILGYCWLRERHTLGALFDVVGDRQRLLAWRRHIMARRRVIDDEVVAWFGRLEERPIRGEGCVKS